MVVLLSFVLFGCLDSPMKASSDIETPQSDEEVVDSPSCTNPYEDFVLPERGTPEPCSPDNSGVEDITLVSDASGSSFTFKVYTPPGYDCSDQEYPVSLFLHGVNGDPSVINRVLPSLIESMEKGIVGPFIIVAPDGYLNTMWADNAAGDKTAESDAINQILPYIDANYRTLEDRKFRAVQGYSMGGFGAMEWATKFPELFFAGINYDGALHDWDTLNSTAATVNAGAPDEFDFDEDNFLPYSPYVNSALNADTIIELDLVLRSVVGLLDDKNQMFRDQLISLGIWEFGTDYYMDTDCAHNLECLLGLDADQPGKEANATGRGEDMWELLWDTMEDSLEASNCP